MNNRLSKILGNLNLEKLRNDRRIVVFSVCLLIATSLWFLNALGKDYTTTLSFSVKYVNPPKNLFLTNTPPSRFELNVEAHGFTLLRHKLAFSFSPIVLDLSEIRQNAENEGNTIQIATQNLVQQIDNQVSKEISVTDVTPKTISLVFDSLETKMVKVVPQVRLEFKPQFYLKGSVIVKPDSLQISGPAAILDTIKMLQTETKTFQDLDKNVERVVRVNRPVNTNLSPDKVMLYIQVEKFTEKELTLPIQAINNPEGVQLKLFPPQASVLFMVGLSDYENISSDDFRATVDYNQAVLGNSTLDVTIDSMPQFVQLLKVSPGSVEYLIETE